MVLAAASPGRPTPFPRLSAREEAVMTTVYSVIGEHRDNPDQLLALGADGRHYALTLPEGALLPVELDDEWRLDPDRPERDDVLLDPPA